MPNITVLASDPGLPFPHQTRVSRLGEALRLLASAIAASAVFGAVLVICIALRSLTNGELWTSRARPA